MNGLSQRLACLVLLASASSLLSYASRAFAQLPVFVPEPVPTSEPAPVVPAPALAPSNLPPAPPAPPSAGVPGDTLSGPAPAKAEVITARPAVDAPSDDPQDLDDGVDDAHERRRWYGWQTLVADGISVSSVLLGAQRSSADSEGQTFFWLGLLGYEVAPGIVHFVHRNPGRGFASMGIRLGLPLAGVFIGASLASNCNRNLCEADGAGIGALLGMAGAIAIDAAVFSYDDARRSPGPRAGLVPLLALTPQQALIGVGGQL